MAACCVVRGRGGDREGHGGPGVHGGVGVLGGERDGHGVSRAEEGDREGSGKDRFRWILVEVGRSRTIPSSLHRSAIAAGAVHL